MLANCACEFQSLIVQAIFSLKLRHFLSQTICDPEHYADAFHSGLFGQPNFSSVHIGGMHSSAILLDISMALGRAENERIKTSAFCRLGLSLPFTHIGRGRPRGRFRGLMVADKLLYINQLN